MFGLSLFRPSGQSNISTSGEERFKYSYPRESKISQMPYPRANKDNQIPTPCPPRRLYIDRCINLSSLIGVRLDVIQSSAVKVHYRFPGNRLPSMTKLRVLFMKRVFSYVNYNNVYGRWITTQYPRQIKENSRLNNSGFNKWLRILAGKELQTKLLKTENVDFKFRASNGTAKANGCS